MRVDRAPATVVVCCGLPAGAGMQALAACADAASRADVPVTWVCRSADMPAVVAGIGDADGATSVALSLDAAQLSDRPVLRREIAKARAAGVDPVCAVASGAPPLDHRPLLVEQGIHTIAVSGFDVVMRSSRRPPPAGWPCRSVVWGLWEVRSVPRLPRRAISRLLPVVPFGIRLAPGSLTVLHLEPPADRHGVPVELTRVVQWLGRRPAGVRTALLADLPHLISGADSPESGSVLKRAA